MNDLCAKRISDSVHGTVELSEVEAEVVNCRVFQRLRNVKQLGLAYQVYPTADYSRFSHSIGVCHIAGQQLENLKRSESIPDRDIQRYRLAALLHDIGHYPFSHAMEDAIQDYYSSQIYQDVEAPETTEVTSKYYKHERMGAKVLDEDEELRNTLNQYDFVGDEISSIFRREFRREDQPKYANLISSDLDADRIDYLLRTSRHTGLPYGAVDLNYLLTQLSVDSDHRVCLSTKALRAADHFLLCRYFDYQQVAYHKTVVAIEKVLKDVLDELLAAGEIDCSAQAMVDRLTRKEWCDFDDAYILQKMQTLRLQTSDEITRLKIDSLLRRNPPKMVAQLEHISDRNERDAFLNNQQQVTEKIGSWSNEFGIPEKLWYVWSKISPLTKIGSHLPLTRDTDKEKEKEREDELEQAIRLLHPTDDQSKPIMACKQSLMSILSDYALFTLRVYVLLPSAKQQLRDSIADKIKQDLPYVFRF